MPQVRCKICQTEFYIKPSHHKKGFGKFCSRSCQRKGQLKGRFRLCEQCGKEVWRTPRDEKRSKSKKFFCSKSCQTQWRNNIYIGPKHANWKGGEYTYHRIMQANGRIAACEKCGMKNKRVLVIHHIDHNRKHNKIENLMWLCRNCHYLIHDGKTA